MATPTSYVPLEGGFMQSVGGTVPSFTGSTPSLFTSTSFLYTLFFVIIVVVASTKYAQAGLFRMEASQHGITESNKIFKKTTLGLVGVFSLWLILSTVNKDLLSGDVGLDALRSNAGEFGGGGATGVIPKPDAPTGGGSKSYQDRLLSHNSNYSKLATIGVDVNRGATMCSESQFLEKKPACTSLAYLDPSTISMLTSLSKQCVGCILVITGGTEPGHLTHSETKRAIDLRLKNDTDGLFVFIKNNATSKLGENSNCVERYVWQGWTFCDEKPTSNRHFHVD